MKDSFTFSSIAGSGVSPAQSEPYDTAPIQAPLTERFEMLKLIGTSGSSFCFLARDLAKRNASDDEGRLVRLKVLSDDAAVDDLQKELFYLEAEAAAKLSHHNITRTTEAEALGGIHFYTVEQCASCESLRELLDMRSWLEIELALSIALQVVDALEYAHQSEVLHLNLNPANILIERDGKVLITDFGIHSRQDAAWAHIARSRRHRPQYSSPEQIQGSSADHRSDLYSLGIILFEMLTDRVPFDSTDADVIKRKHLTQAPHSPQIFRPGISNYLSALIMTLIEKNPDWRFRSAAQLRVGLGRVAQSCPPDEAASDCIEDKASPAQKSQAVEAPAQGAKPDSTKEAGNQAAVDGSARQSDEAAKSDSSVDGREPFEPPVITVIDPPPYTLPPQKAKADPSTGGAQARGAEARENRQSRLLVAAIKSRKRVSAIFAVLLVILLLVSFSGRNYLSTASSDHQVGHLDAIDEPDATQTEPASQLTEGTVSAERTNLSQIQSQPDNTGLNATADAPTTPGKVRPLKKRYVRRAAVRRVRRGLQAKRKYRKPLYLRRAREWR